MFHAPCLVLRSIAVKTLHLVCMPRPQAHFHVSPSLVSETANVKGVHGAWGNVGGWAAGR